MGSEASSWVVGGGRGAQAALAARAAVAVAHRTDGRAARVEVVLLWFLVVF